MLMTLAETRATYCPLDQSGGTCCGTACAFWRWADAPQRVERVALGYCGAGSPRPPTRKRDGRLPTPDEIAGTASDAAPELQVCAGCPPRAVRTA